MLQKSSKQNLKMWMLSIWLFLMMVIPAITSKIKFAALAFLLLIYLCTNQFHLTIKKSFIRSIIIWLSFFTFTFINARINGFKFDYVLLEIYIIRPCVFMVMCNMITDRKGLEELSKILVVLSLFIGIYNFVVLLQTLRIIPATIIENTWFGTNLITIYGENFLTYRTMNQVSLMFLMPYLYVLRNGSDYFNFKWKYIINISTIINLIVCLTCGRRILQVETILVLFIGVLQNIKERSFLKRKNIISILLCGLMAIGVIFIFGHKTFCDLIKIIAKTIQEAVINTTNPNSIRGYQAICLIKMWKRKPLIGWGISAYSIEYNAWRTGEFNTGWSYEYFYLALLFQIGGIGILFVGRYIYTVMKKLAQFASLDDMKNITSNIIVRAVLWGFLGFLLCGATNPLVTSSWMWFIVLTTYNYCVKELELEKFEYTYRNCVV